jgi:hypothetical protein
MDETVYIRLNYQSLWTNTAVLPMEGFPDALRVLYSIVLLFLQPLELSCWLSPAALLTRLSVLICFLFALFHVTSLTVPC